MLSRDFSKQTCRYLELVTNFRCSRVAIYKAKKYRKNKKIDIIEAIHLVERASSLHAYWRLEPVAQIVWSQKLNRKKIFVFRFFFLCLLVSLCFLFKPRFQHVHSNTTVGWAFRRDFYSLLLTILKERIKKNKKHTHRYPCFYRIHILIPTLPPPERERSKISFTWSIRDRLCIEAGS